ncbi:MAG: hybrid sensor histidine kinase/response regulator, partial [Deltaproteobacteria bacterium CG_4_10_14_3_um_filter_60_8]
QVIMNLAVNARDAMPAGGKLTIETRNVELATAQATQRLVVPPGSYVLLAVTDTGEGMDAATRGRIFEPFFTTKELGKGTGLGLSSVYGIVKQSGGSLWVYSEVGRGTTFKIYLPRVDEEQVRVEEQARATGVEVPARGVETLLVVEDEGAVRNLAARVLTAAGYQVLTAVNGEEALVLLEDRQGPVHLLLTDVVMPGMGGRELAARLATNWPDLKVLFMSGYTNNAIVHHGVLDEGTQFIGKPFSVMELTRKVREVLDS